MRHWRLLPLGRGESWPEQRDPGSLRPLFALFWVAVVLYVVATAVYFEFERLLLRDVAPAAGLPSNTVPPAAGGAPGVARPAPDAQQAAVSAVAALPQAGHRRSSAPVNREVTETVYTRVGDALDPLKRQETLRILYTDILQERADLIELQQRLAHRPRTIVTRHVERPENPVLPTRQTAIRRQPAAAATTFVAQPSLPALRSSPLQPLDTAAAARSVQDLVQAGNHTVALNLLRGFNERQAAKILSILWQREPEVATQFARQLQTSQLTTQ